MLRFKSRKEAQGAGVQFDGPETGHLDVAMTFRRSTTILYVEHPDELESTHIRRLPGTASGRSDKENVWVSSDGRVFREVPSRATYQGYKHVWVSLGRGTRNTRRKLNTLVHRLVAFAWIPNPEKKPDVNHLNNVKDDNRKENLAWCTPSENGLHRERFRLRCAWTGRKVSQRMVTAMAAIAEGKTRDEIAAITGYSIKMVNALKAGRRGKSLNYTKS